MDGDVLEHGVFASGGEGGVALAVAGVHAPAAPRHHALAVEEVVDVEINGPTAGDGVTGAEIELVEAGENDHVGDVAGALQLLPDGEHPRDSFPNVDERPKSALPLDDEALSAVLDEPVLLRIGDFND